MPALLEPRPSYWRGHAAFAGRAPEETADHCHAPFGPATEEETMTLQDFYVYELGLDWTDSSRCAGSGQARRRAGRLKAEG